MAAGYGEGRVTIGISHVGRVAVTGVAAVPALNPRIRFGLSWTLRIASVRNTDVPARSIGWSTSGANYDSGPMTFSSARLRAKVRDIRSAPSITWTRRTPPWLSIWAGFAWNGLKSAGPAVASP